ncbi:MAG TPA: ABC transporter ATP-binding protein [Terracidiphilus sp.]|nr:ABC transporter ATP-binding protein [Terracidiphilus sp.]
MNDATRLAASGGFADSIKKPALLIRGLRKAFADVQAVDGMDLEVAAGECFGLLGPNGAGKTTTIEICEGLTEPDEGQVELLGLNWSRGSRELRQRIGIQLQETQFPDKLTVEETLRLFRSFFRHGISVDESIRTAQLEEKRGSRVGGLSGGQKQRLAMACALVGDPELLFLDEPTTGLDPQARRHLWDLVDELKLAGRTIILTTHYMEEAERLCDRVAIMDHGRVIALGTPQQLIATVGGEDIVEFAVSYSQVPNAGSPPHEQEAVRGNPGPGAPGHERVQGVVDAEKLTAIPGVQSHRVDAALHQLSVSELHTTVPRIFAALAAEGLHLSEFRTHSATLEDVFVRLTGRNLRDE